MDSKFKIDIDSEKKIFFLSVPIYQNRIQIPYSVLQYVEARKEKTFKPHKTSFHIDENQEVRLIQEIPIYWGFQPTIRKQVLEFLQMAQKCREMLLEIAREEAIALIKEI